jgi:hypothetical protein
MKYRAWLATSLVRHYPATPPKTRSRMTVEVARNERFHFQVAARHDSLNVEILALTAAAPKGWQVRVRRVAYVPMAHLNTPTMPTDADLEGREHIPGFVPDPLLDLQTVRMGSAETHAFWVTVVPAKSVTPGDHDIDLQIGPEGGRTKRLVLTARVSPVRIPKRRNFRVTNWFYIDTLIDRYQARPGQKRFWTVLDAYLRNLVEHGQDTVYTSVFSVQLDGERTPSQLLRVTRGADGTYQFDWRHVRRFVKAARAAGIGYFEWSHFFSQWGVARALKVYEGDCADGVLLWPRKTKATSPVYREFLAQFLPAFHQFLKKEKLLACSYFHVSDEPSSDHLENYKAAREMLRELAPWMKVMDAMSHLDVAEHTDMPIPSIGAGLKFLDADIDCWCYFCCGPRGAFLNRLMDTPLPKMRMVGWLCYRWPFKGFLHWGYNYWNRCQQNEPIDPFAVSDGGNWPGWPYGDTFQVYPGEDGPIDSIRWETFASGLQDYALLQGRRTDRDGKLLAACRSFEDFPKAEAWLTKARHALLFGDQ